MSHDLYRGVMVFALGVFFLTMGVFAFQDFSYAKESVLVSEQYSFVDCFADLQSNTNGAGHNNLCATPATTCNADTLLDRECTTSVGAGDCSCVCGRFGEGNSYMWLCVKCTSGDCNVNTGYCKPKKKITGFEILN